MTHPRIKKFLKYGPDKILLVKVTTVKVKANQDNQMMLQGYTPNQCPCQVSTSYTLRFLRNSLKMIEGRSRSL